MKFISKSFSHKENQTVSECGESESSYYTYLIIAQCFHGVGGAAVYTLAIPYMDDQVKTKNTPLYIGMLSLFGFLDLNINGMIRNTQKLKTFGWPI